MINPFMIIIAVLFAGAAIFEMYKKNIPMAVVYWSWVVSNIALAIVGKGVGK